MPACLIEVLAPKVDRASQAALGLRELCFDGPKDPGGAVTAGAPGLSHVLRRLPLHSLGLLLPPLTLPLGTSQSSLV
ncbi:hypothetical protein ColTof3_10862 [Colletotrichum tofieldiae]|nr:hypothetical protein ColTof3_10862 [Colletotrichum tofieldiae]